MQETGGPAMRALRHFRGWRRLSLLAAALALVPEARAQQVHLDTPCTCTREFRSIEVDVVDARGRPLTAWTATVRRARDGRVVRRVSGGTAAGSPKGQPAVQGRTPVLAETPGAPGTDGGQAPRLAVLDDGLLDLLASPEEVFVVDVRSGRRSGTARFAVGYAGTARCRCHVRLVRGPSRIAVR